MYETLAMYIDGQWCQGGDGRSEDVLNPATEASLGRLPHASRADLDRALEAAGKGFKLWRATNAYDRGRILKKTAELIRQRQEQIARILILEEGKVLAEARLEVGTTADIIEWMGEEGRRAYGRIIPGREGGIEGLDAYLNTKFVTQLGV